MPVTYDPARVATAFNKLFQTYPSFQAAEADEALRVYFEAVEPYQTIDIEQAVKNILSGSAPGMNPNFAPPAPALAGEVRRVMNLRLDAENREKRLHPRLPSPEVVHSPESIARVKAMVANLSAKLRTADATTRYDVGDPDGDRDVA